MSRSCGRSWTSPTPSLSWQKGSSRSFCGPTVRWELPWNHSRRLVLARQPARDQRLAAAGTDWQWLVSIITKERKVVRQRLIDVLRCRLRYDWRAFFRTTLQPVRRTRYSVRSLIGNAGANLRTTGHYVPALNTAVVARLRAVLAAGRCPVGSGGEEADGGDSARVLGPRGVFVGSQRDLEALGVAGQPLFISTGRSLRCRMVAWAA